MYRVADQIVEILEKAGVKRIYGIVGDSLNPVTDALRRRKTIEWIHVRHEEVAAFAASAEAQLSGNLAVCCGSSGPGNLHLINGLFDAHRNHAPVLAIASHIPQSQVGMEYSRPRIRNSFSRNAVHMRNWFRKLPRPRAF